MRPPATQAEPIHERVFGVEVDDPFRWLEGDLHADARVRDWIDRQARFTDAYLAALPDRDRIREHLGSVWAFEKLGSPVRRGGRYFQEWNSGLLNHNLIVTHHGLDEEPTVLIDPNTMDPEVGDVVRDWQPSFDGSLLAHTVQRHGADWRTLRFLDVASGDPLSDTLHGLKAAQFAWHRDHRTIFYTRFVDPSDQTSTEPTLDSAVYRHGLGEPQSADRLVYATAPGTARLHMPRVSDDGLWLVIIRTNAGGAQAEVHVQSLAVANSPVVPMVTDGADRWQFVGGDTGALLFLTDLDAPNCRVVSLDPAAGPEQTPVTVVPEGEHAIRGVCLAGAEIVVQYQEGLSATLHRFTRAGRFIGSVALAPLSAVDQLRGDPEAAELFFRVSSMVEAPAIQRCDLRTGHVETVGAPKVCWNADDYVVRQIVATSADGTQVPVTLAHARHLDGHTPQPTVLMLYGGFGISPDLSFWESRFGWMSMGGVFAIAHTRGGAEFGSEWANAGRKAGRHLVIADYLAAAGALRESGITSPRRLVALGASNGGMMVAAAINTRPDAFAAALCRVPVTDLLRYTRFTLGRIWVDELGDPEIEEDFRTLLSYSPLHNVRSGAIYPAILVRTSEDDDRVVPSHSFKYVSTLQAADIGSAPRLLRIEANAGHGEGKPADKLIEEFTDLWSFAAAQVGLEMPGAAHLPEPGP